MAIQFEGPRKRCNLSIEQFPIFAALIQVCGNTTSKFDKQYKLAQVFHIVLWCCNRIAGLKHRIARFRVDIIYVSLHLLHSSTSPLLHIKLGYYSTTHPPSTHRAVFEVLWKFFPIFLKLYSKQCQTLHTCLACAVSSRPTERQIVMNLCGGETKTGYYKPSEVVISPAKQLPSL